MFVVIASEAKQSRAACAALDCFVASLLAMTKEATIAGWAKAMKRQVGRDE